LGETSTRRTSLRGLGEPDSLQRLAALGDLATLPGLGHDRRRPVDEHQQDEDGGSKGRQQAGTHKESSDRPGRAPGRRTKSAGF
jgi:hypothetical protein